MHDSRCRPLLYIIYNSDLPTTLETSTATFVDNTAVLASHKSPIIASHNLQSYLTIQRLVEEMEDAN